MSWNILKGLSIILGVIFLYGCAATEKVEVRRYIEVKDRVDQEMGGNAGFLTGTPQPEDRSGIRKTRKIYVLEISQEAAGADTSVEGEKDADYGDVGLERPDPRAGNIIKVSKESMGIYDIDVPPLEEEDKEGSSKASPSFVEYKVQKDDTLQKISKKFYDSYSKWPKIYEANKNVIDNPERIKPGIVLQIPMK